MHTQLAVTAAKETERGLNRFLHHFADVPRKQDISSARITCRFDVQYFAASRRVSQTGNDSRFTGLELCFAHIFRRTEHLRHQFRRDRCILDFSTRNLRRNTPADSCDLALQFAHAGFVCVIVNDLSKRVLLEFALFRLESVFIQLPLYEISLGNFDFLALGVTGYGNYFNPIPQRFGHALDVVRSADEDYLRQIKRHVEVTIDKRVVLPRIEHFEQRAGRVPAKIRADLVDLIEHENRVPRTCTPQSLNDSTRHRANVRAAMTADLCFIAHAAETDPHKFAAQRIGNRLAKAGFAHTRRPEKTEDRAVPLRIKFAHSQIFDQPFLYLFQIVMVAIEDLLGLIEIKVVLAQFVPWKIGNDLDVTNNHREFRTGGWNEIEPLQFALSLFHHRLRRVSFLEPLAQLLRLFFAAALGLA